ncbi:biopolymer transporter ExbD [Ignavibacteriales bacterium]
MAELDTSAKGGHGKGKKKGPKKASTRIDLTPMVDLAFLLVTFFMLTTTFSKPQVMDIVMPVKDKEQQEEQKINQTELRQSEAMTILIGGKDTLLYYFGLDTAKTVSIPQFEPKNKAAYEKLRADIIKKQQELQDDGDAKTKKENLFVVIKPFDQSSYQNLVDVLDMMNFTEVKKYAIVDVAESDLSIYNNRKK